MDVESKFTFLKVKNGRAYFARVVAISDSKIEGVQISTVGGNLIPHTDDQWRVAARVGAEKAWRLHLERGGEKKGLHLKTVLGTDADSNNNTVEVAAFCASWKALGHPETDWEFTFDQEWKVCLRK